MKNCQIMLAGLDQYSCAVFDDRILLCSATSNGYATVG